MKRALIVAALLSSVVATAATQKAVFAGGCFWCMEPPFEKLDGVVSAESGYTGGTKTNPTYEEVSAGGTGHFEAVEVTYDPAKISYETLLDTYWKNIDPLDPAGQFCDKGESYKSAIFPVDESQRKAALASLDAQTKSPRFKGKTIATKVIEAKPFYKAEAYHQDYYKTNPLKYKYYRYGCGRDKRLEEVWGAKK